MIALFECGSKAVTTNLTPDSPLSEVRIHHSIREALTTNTNAFQYTVTGELMHHQMCVDDSRLLEFVGDDTADEVGMGRMKSGHQLVQLFLQI